MRDIRVGEDDRLENAGLAVGVKVDESNALIGLGDVGVVVDQSASGRASIRKVRGPRSSSLGNVQTA